MAINIRDYQESDKPQLIVWMEQMQDYLINLDPMKRLLRRPKYGPVFTQEMLSFVSKNTGVIYIATIDQKPVGFVAGAIQKQSKKNLLELIPTKLGIVSDLFVDEKYRQNGIGKLLLNKMEHYLKAKNCDHIWLTVVAYNPAHKFYQKYGFINREIGMIKKVK